MGKGLIDGWDNPIGTQGFDFLAFASTEPETMSEQLQKFGFIATAKHPQRNITLYKQGNIRFLLNGEKQGFAYEFALKHGPCAYAMGFRVNNASEAIDKLLTNGAESFLGEDDGCDSNAPVINGIGGSLLYLTDEQDCFSHFDSLEHSHDDSVTSELTYIDHVTHNVFKGNMDEWAGFYERLFNFKEVRYFDIEGKLTGLKSRAMTSPCGRIRIPINESSDDKSQIEEYLQEYKGEGIQHIALGTDDIYQTIRSIRERGVRFLTVPDTYYEKVDERVKSHGESLEELSRLRILVDGAPTEGQGLLLQIFTENTFGPIFFEIIQRKGNEGFGEGNFQALFESIELDQIRRGTLTDG